MAEVTQTTIKATDSQSIEYVLYFISGIVETLLVLRFVLKLMGASTSSSFVRAIYGVSGILIMPFEGIFRRAVTQGIETISVFEPATVVACILYALLTGGVVKLVQILSGEKQAE